MEGKIKKRDSYIDAVKGIGIISIVIGHASWNINIGEMVLPVGPFVYLYHLAIFAFCSGYLFDENITDFWGYLVKKLKGLYKPFLVYSVIYLLFRNVFIEIGILQGEKFTLDRMLITFSNLLTFNSMGEMLITFSNLLTFNSMGEMLSAFWFLPMLFFALAFFAAIWVITNHIKNAGMKEALRLVCYCAVGVVGIYATERQMGLLCNIQISYLMVPVVAMGNYFKRFSGKKILNFAGLGISFLILGIVIYSNIGIIELSKFMIINRWLFYPVIICGMYFCLSLTKILSKVSILEKGLALTGRYSFDIMALHFVAFKVIDYIVCRLTGQMDLLGIFPHSFTNLWPIYYLAGVGLPILLKKLFGIVKELWHSKKGVRFK